MKPRRGSFWLFAIGPMVKDNVLSFTLFGSWWAKIVFIYFSVFVFVVSIVDHWPLRGLAARPIGGPETRAIRRPGLSFVRLWGCCSRFRLPFRVT